MYVLNLFHENIFRTTVASGLRPAIQGRIEELELPWNQPYDRLVMRPSKGRAVVSLPDGLQIVILGPDRRRLEELHRYVSRDAEKKGGTIESFPEESFSAVDIERAPMPLLASPSEPASDSLCVPSDNARKLAGGAYIDMYPPNLASNLLFACDTVINRTLSEVLRLDSCRGIKGRQSQP